MKKKVALILSLIVISGAYLYFSNSDRIKSIEQIYPRYVLSDIEQFGNNSGKGNIIALSPYLHTYDFSSQQAFENMMRYYLNFAQQKHLLNDSTIIALPEYIGTWLVVLNEKANMYDDTSVNDAMKTMVYSNLFSFAKAYLHASGKEKEKEAIFRMKAEKMATAYQQTFSTLAKEFNVSIVAGSIVLPDPEIKEGKLVIRPNGKLFNISVVYDNKGKALLPLIKKAYPINNELGFTCKAPIHQSVFTLPLGNIGVLICADSWYPDCYQSLKDKSIKAIISPSFVSESNAWQTPWKGYEYATPRDINTADKNSITEKDAWKKYAVVARAQSAGIPYAVNVFLRGNFWNIGSDGNTLLRLHDSIFESKNHIEKTGSLVNLWIE